jgi:hypothetical protein
MLMVLKTNNKIVGLGGRQEIEELYRLLKKDLVPFMIYEYEE